MKRTLLILSLLLWGVGSLIRAASQDATVAKDTLGAFYDTFIDYSQKNSLKETDGFLKVCNKMNFWRQGIVGFNMSEASSMREKVLLGLVPYAYNSGDDFWRKPAITTYPLAIYAIKREIQTPTCWSILYGSPDGDPAGDGFSYTGTYPLVYKESDMELVGEIEIGKEDSMTYKFIDITEYVNKHINTSEKLYFLLSSNAEYKVDCSLFFYSSEGNALYRPGLFLFDEKPIVSISSGREIFTGEKDTVRVYFPTNGVPPFKFSYTDGTNTYECKDIQTYEYSFEVQPTENTTYTLISASDKEKTLSVDGSAVYTVIQPQAILSGNNKTYQGTHVNLKVSFLGVAPFSYVISGTDGSQYSESNITKSEILIPVKPSTTTTYSLASASDVNNTTIQTSGTAVVNIIAAPKPMLSTGSDDWVLYKGDEFGTDEINTQMWSVKNGDVNMNGEEILFGVKQSGSAYTTSQIQLLAAMPTETDMYMEMRIKPMKVNNSNITFSAQTYDTHLSSKYQQRYGMTFPKVTYKGDNIYNFHYSLTDWKTTYYIYEIDPTKTNYVMVDSVNNRHMDDYMVLGVEITARNIRYFINGELVSEGANMTGFEESDLISVLTAPGSAYQDIAQNAYGYYEQEDWHYYGGYTGDKMALQVGLNIDMATFDAADIDKTAAVDYIRFYRRSADMAEPIRDETLEGLSEQKTFALDANINTAADNTFYFSAIFSKETDSEFNVSLLNKEGQIIVGTAVDAANTLRTGFGSNRLYYASTISAKPMNKKQNYYEDGQMYLLAGRVETHKDADDYVSVALFPIQNEKTQPYFYPNIEGEYGHTAMGNGWDLNYKYEIDATEISSLQIGGKGEFICEKVMLSTSFDGILPRESFAILDNDLHYIGAGETTILKVTLSGVAPWTITYKEGNEEHTIKDIATNTYEIAVNPTETTTYSLVSVIDGDNKKGIATGQNTVKVKSPEARNLYPTFDTYADGNQPEVTFSDKPTGYIKKHATFQRDAYFRFDISEYDPKDSIDVASFSMFILSNDQGDATQLTLYQVKSGMPDPLESLTFMNAPSEANLKPLGTITAPNPGFYGVRVNWDLHKFINRELRSGAGIVDLCVKLTGGNTASLLTWRQYVADSVEIEPQFPYLAMDPYMPTSIDEIRTSNEGDMLFVYPNPASGRVNILGNYNGCEVQIVSPLGNLIEKCHVEDNSVNLPIYNGVVYLFIKNQSGESLCAPLIIR